MLHFQHFLQQCLHYRNQIADCPEGTPLQDWGEILYAAMRSNDTGGLGMYIGVVFVIFSFLVLHFVIRNLFV